jgi:hypothetical protein
MLDLGVGLLSLPVQDGGVIGAASVEPIVIAQTAGAAVVARAFEPIPVEQTAGVQVVSRAFEPIVVGQTASVAIVAEEGNDLVPPVFDFDARFNLTFGSSLRLTGTSPSIGLSVTPASGGSLTYAANCPGLRVEITGTGALGAGVFRVSYNSGTSWAYSGVTIPGGGTYDLDGAAAGLRLTFSAGTYNSGDFYQGRITQWQSDEGYTVTQGTLANMPIYINLGDGAPYLQSVIANNMSMLGTDAAVIAVLTNNPAFSLLQKIAIDVPDAISFQFCVADGAQATNRNRRFGTDTGGAGRWAQQFTNDAGTTGPQVSGVNITNATHVLQWYSPGTTLTLYEDGTVTSINGASCNPGTLTPTRYSFFCRCNSTLASFFGGRTYRVIGWDQELDAATEGAAWLAEVNA